MKIYAVIPARSGSKGLKNKNIKLINNKPLISYSINHAKKLNFINRIFCSTDSEKYAKIAVKYGAEVPFLRSHDASKDNSMEDEILKDLRKNFHLNNIEEPDLLVWLRPTFVFRSLKDIKVCTNKLISNPVFTSARIITQAENRLYKIKKDYLKPNFNDGNKSMIRRQDLEPSYKVFNTDIIRFKKNDFNDMFLGEKVFSVISDPICGLDIDNKLDFEISKLLIENSPKFSK